MKFAFSSIALVVVLAGCASWEPYINAGIGAPVNDRNLAGSSPFLRLDAGAAFDVGRRSEVWCELSHLSSIRDGEPFRDTPETTYDMGFCGLRFGRGVGSE